jgi:DNA-directed RNA polymerase specialized sigma24 family protein
MATQPASSPRNASEQARLLARLLECHSGLLRSDARRNSRSSEDAEDAMQDAHIQFLRKYEGPADVADALRWMRVVTKRCAWRIGNEARRDASRRAASVSVDGGEREAPAARCERRGPAEEVELRAELRRRTVQFAALKRDQRIALVLVAFGYSYAEIQACLGWSHTKLNRCAVEGRAALRAMQGGENAPPDD